MKIARPSRLIVIAPGLILALLLFSSGTSKIEQTGGAFPTLVPSAAAQQVRAAQTRRVQAQEVTLAGSAKEVAATASSGPDIALYGTFNEFGLTRGAHPQLMASAPDGSIFFAQAGANKITQIVSPGGAAADKVMARDFAVPTADSYPEGILVAPDGMVWFTEQNGHRIGRLDVLAGTITEYPTPTLNSGPVGITIGPDNNIWFTEAYAGKIGMLDPKAPDKMAEFIIPTAVSAPLYITSGPDGALWFVGVRSHKLGRIDAVSKAIVEYPLPSPQAMPTSVLLGSDGALWIAEMNADKIARFDPKSRKYTDEILVSSGKNGSRSGPGILVNGPDGNIWFTQMYGNQIARLNVMSRQLHEFSVPSALRAEEPTVIGAADTAADATRDARMSLKTGEKMGPTSGPGGIVFGPDGNIWYTSIFSDKVSRLRVRPAGEKRSR
jgi:virginiamycin B lyase